MKNFEDTINNIILSHFNGERQKEIVAKMDEDIGVLVLNNMHATKDILSAVSEMVADIIPEKKEYPLTHSVGMEHGVAGYNKAIDKMKQKAISYGLEIEKGKA